MKIKKPRGTKDIYGKEALKYRMIEDAGKKVAEKYNFQEMITPVFEESELFKRSMGEETEVVNKQMYEFQDKNNREIALRPEGTAGVVRAYIENNLQSNILYKKFFYYGSMYRYERPSSGRYREFRQFGIEKFGIESVIDEVEIFQIIVDIFDKLGLEIDLKINNIGCECRKEYIEKVKEYLEECKDRLGKVDVEKLDSGNILRVLDSKDEKTIEVVKEAPNIIDYICEKCKESYNKLKVFLNELDIKYTEDFKMVRGLDYYSGNVFEVKIKEYEELGSVAGGGKYESLVEQLGGKKEVGFGFGIGVDRVVEALNEKETEERLCYVVTIGKGLELEQHALKIAEQFRRYKENNVVEIDVSESSLKSKLRKADKAGAEHVFIIGEEELKNNTYSIKTLK